MDRLLKLHLRLGPSFSDAHGKRRCTGPTGHHLRHLVELRGQRVGGRNRGDGVRQHEVTAGLAVAIYDLLTPDLSGSGRSARPSKEPA